MPHAQIEAKRDYMREYRADPKNRAKESARKTASAKKRRAADPVGYRDREWAYQIWTTYRMRPEEYFDKLKAQGGVCKYCGTDEPGGRWGRFCVDHDHNKPKGEGNRALLCHKCNVMVSMACDRPEVLRAAADDLERYNGRP